jgi:hypothetical protein
MRKGFTLVLTLLLSTLLAVMGLAFLGKRALEYGSVPKVQSQAVAQALAEAGMEDVRVKLEKDPFFPPITGYLQESYTYSEDLLDPEDGSYVGSYTVSLNLQRKEQPYRIMRMLSIGSAGPRLSPVARYRIYAELDVANEERGGSGPNSQLFRFINWRESDVDPAKDGGFPLAQ